MLPCASINTTLPWIPTYPYPSIVIPYPSTVLVKIKTLIFFFRHEQQDFFLRETSAKFLRDEKPEDHWSCIAHLSAEDMLKSAVIEENKFKHSPWAGADNPLGPKIFYVNRKASSLWSFVASLKRISSNSDFIHIFS